MKWRPQIEASSYHPRLTLAGRTFCRFSPHKGHVCFSISHHVRIRTHAFLGRGYSPFGSGSSIFLAVDPQPSPYPSAYDHIASLDNRYANDVIIRKLFGLLSPKYIFHTRLTYWKCDVHRCGYMCMYVEWAWAKCANFRLTWRTGCGLSMQRSIKKIIDFKHRHVSSTNRNKCAKYQIGCELIQGKEWGLVWQKCKTKY